MTELRIDIWSDIACPWCFVGKRRLEKALETHPKVNQANVVWHSFELDPSAPPELDNRRSTAERLATKYRIPVARAEAMIEQMTVTGASVNAEMDFTKLRAGSTFEAHRLLHWARTLGKQDALKERLVRAYLAEGELMSDVAALARLATDVGLDADEAAGVLASDDFGKEVRDDESQAARLGIRGVPFFVFEGRLAVSGAQPPEAFHQVFDQILDERERDTEVPDALVCGPDGCV